MQSNDRKSGNVDLSLLLPYFSEGNSLEQSVGNIGHFLATFMQTDTVLMIRESSGDLAVWNAGGTKLDEWLGTLLMEEIERLKIEMREENDSFFPVQWVSAELGQGRSGLLSAIFYGGEICGWLAVVRNEGTWSDVEKERLQKIVGMIGLPFAFYDSVEARQRGNFVFNTILNDIKANVYVTEIDSDKIVFMNRAMQTAYGLKFPEGQICWQVLQRGMERRCAHCPKDALRKSRADSPSVQWEEVSMVNGRTYHNYDRFVPWIDGRMVHMQQSIDVTELKSANFDELTRVLARKPGKNMLRTNLEYAKAKRNAVTVCLYDINLLKEVNDQLGHAEGDRMIVAVTDAVREVLVQDEFLFRLSSDEFVAVFNAKYKDAQQRMEKAIEFLKSVPSEYELSFCYGLMEVSPEQEISPEEALFLADARMYEQKRRYHIRRNEEKRKKTAALSLQADSFTYDKERLYSAIIQSTDDYLYVCNMKTGIFRYPKSMVEEFDLPGEVVKNAAAVWGARVHPDDRAAFLESNQEIADGRADSHCVEYRARNRRDEWVWVRCRGRLERDENGEASIFAGFITNLGQKNRIDQLTGLFNKLEFEAQIRKLTESDAKRPFGVMILGIDDLKHINDLYDRTFGDEVIRIVSQKIRSLLSSDATVYRLDGDEFGIVAREADLVEMQRIYRAMHHLFENQQEYDGKKYYSTLSAGCLFYPQDAGNYLELIKYAGYSLEYAKSHGKKRCVFFSQEILGHRARALAMMEALRESVENDFAGFSLKFQPLVEASSGDLIGIEALVRWRSEQFGEVSPVEFIPLLEDSGMIVPVGKWIFRTSMQISRKWHIYRPNLVIDVNLSYLQIEGSDFVSFLRETLKEEGYPPGNLVVELTESHFAQKNHHVRAIFEELRSMGVRVAMDDFGTGYSTLGILKEAPADIVKIDKTFIRDIRTSSFDATFIRFVVALCHDVGIKVCLEGVETEAEYQIVSQMGLDMIQGFLFDRPLSEKEFSDKYLYGRCN